MWTRSPCFLMEQIVERKLVESLKWNFRTLQTWREDGCLRRCASSSSPNKRASNYSPFFFFTSAAAGPSNAPSRAHVVSLNTQGLHSKHGRGGGHRQLFIIEANLCRRWRRESRDHTKWFDGRHRAEDVKCDNFFFLGKLGGGSGCWGGHSPIKSCVKRRTCRRYCGCACSRWFPVSYEGREGTRAARERPGLALFIIFLFLWS